LISSEGHRVHGEVVACDLPNSPPQPQSPRPDDPVDSELAGLDSWHDPQDVHFARTISPRCAAAWMVHL